MATVQVDAELFGELVLELTRLQRHQIMFCSDHRCCSDGDTCDPYTYPHRKPDCPAPFRTDYPNAHPAVPYIRDRLDRIVHHLQGRKSRWHEDAATPPGALQLELEATTT